MDNNMGKLLLDRCRDDGGKTTIVLHTGERRGCATEYLRRKAMEREDKRAFRKRWLISFMWDVVVPVAFFTVLALLAIFTSFGDNVREFSFKLLEFVLFFF